MTELLDYLEDENMEKFEKSMVQKADEIVQRPFKHLTQKSGKEFRAKFLTTMRCWFGCEKWQLELINEYIRLCHHCSLLIDDIQDRTILRRGLPATHLIYGVPTAIQSANYVYFVNMSSMINNDENFKDNINYSQTMRNELFTRYQKEILKGQIMESYWRDNFVCPTIEQYMVMITKKSGMIFRLAVDTMNDFYKKNFNMDDFNDIIGQYFQIRDDYLNLKSTQFHKDKGFCEDLTEGKFSFPIVYAINAYPEDERILEILKKRPKDVETKLECLKILEELGSFDVTIKQLDKMKRLIQDKIQHLGGNEELQDLLDTLEY